jgi:signal transduction histidine kinase
VNRYALLLVLAIATVIAALVLATRSVSRELALSRLRTQFVASVSHELKTPLSLIRMFAESLREGWVGETRKADYYEVITRESERLTGLIDNVLDFSRLEAGTRQYWFGVVDLGQVVRALLERYAFHLKAARVDLVPISPRRPRSERPDGSSRRADRAWRRQLISTSGIPRCCRPAGRWRPSGSLSDRC